MADEKEVREGSHQYVYRTLFDTIAGYMAPTPGKLYTVSPRRRLRATGTSTATAASAVNNVSATANLLDNILTTDAIWWEAAVISLSNNVAGIITVGGVDVVLLGGGNGFGSPSMRIGNILATSLTCSSVANADLAITFVTPFIPFGDMAGFSALRGVSFNQPWGLGVNVTFTNGAGVNQVVNLELLATYRKISSIQEG